ncbi:MAG: methionine import ATP-binding protein MetN [Clostridia bacterium]|jgi:D-methionine transport system ATP-binding protein|nr:methionine import ATP-binding protein MetN [Clostridia bacterium]
MITISNLSKEYNTPYGKITALKNVNLKISRGDIYGIIGFSGAGKSTLIRCINRLEEPDSGKIEIDNLDITVLDKNKLNESRKKIGMIFQQFNLLDSRTVFDNIAFPLEIDKVPQREIKKRVEEILELVELTDKKDAYPSQLSGGQKQRVGIARALANKPDILLSDEATSALDPLTTFSILELLKDINKKLKITIILITHELDVIRYLCRNTAVIEQGEIIESGKTEELFLNPKSETLRKFIEIISGFERKSPRDIGEVI